MENQNEKSLNTNNPENNQANINQNVLGVKRERESDDHQTKNLSDFKKKKSEELINQSNENKTLITQNQQANYLNPQQYHQPNYNLYHQNNPSMINHQVPMQGVYGYPPQQPMYYYNQNAIPSAIPGKIKIFS